MSRASGAGATCGFLALADGPNRSGTKPHDSPLSCKRQGAGSIPATGSAIRSDSLHVLI